MGINISGLIIDKNYQNNISELELILDEKLEFSKEVTLEDGLESFKDDDYVDIYFSDKGTLVLMSMTKGGFDFYAKEQRAFSFVLSEMTMMFCINYTKNNTLLRTIIEDNDELLENEGAQLDFEKQDDDKSELIYHLFEQTLGESFHEIDIESKCYRYNIKVNSNSIDELENYSTSEVINEKKPWWKFW